MPFVTVFPSAIAAMRVTLRNRTLTPVAQLFLDCAREMAKPMAMSRRRQRQKG
jgi:hypothetical protein